MDLLTLNKAILSTGGAEVIHQPRTRSCYRIMARFILIWVSGTIMVCHMEIILRGWICITNILPGIFKGTRIRRMSSGRKCVFGVRSITDIPIIPRSGLDPVPLRKEFGILRILTPSLTFSVD